jgi:inhibitor of KinA sporulation pathway (predicted exonuclease)
MTYSAVAKNTKIESIVFHTISSKVVPFAQASPIGSLAIRVLFAEVVNSMNSEIYQAISAYHIANQGDDRQEIEDTEQEYQLMKLVHGEDAVKKVMDYYNETVIRKAK